MIVIKKILGEVQEVALMFGALLLGLIISLALIVAIRSISDQYKEEKIQHTIKIYEESSRIDMREDQIPIGVDPDYPIAKE